MAEKNKRLRFNIIDVLILIVITASVIAFANYAKVDSEKTAVAAKGSYVVEVANLRAEDVTVFAVGDKILSNKDGRVIGEITGVGEYVNSVDITANMQREEYILAQVPGRYTVSLTVDIMGEKQPYGMTVEGEYAKVGKELDIKTEKHTARMKIVEVKEG